MACKKCLVLIMMFTEMANAFNCRSEYNSIFKIGSSQTKVMLWAVGISTVLYCDIISPGNPLGRLFYVIDLDWNGYGLFQAWLLLSLL